MENKFAYILFFILTTITFFVYYFFYYQRKKIREQIFKDILDYMIMINDKEMSICWAACSCLNKEDKIYFGVFFEDLRLYYLKNRKNYKQSNDLKDSLYFFPFTETGYQSRINLLKNYLKIQKIKDNKWNTQI